MASNMPDGFDEEFLTCPVCMLQFRDPKILPCLHTFCTECLKEWVAKQEPLECPTCRTQFSLPDQGVDGLRTNFYVNNLLDFAAAKKGAELGVPCQTPTPPPSSGSSYLPRAAPTTGQQQQGSWQHQAPPKPAQPMQSSMQQGPRAAPAAVQMQSQQAGNQTRVPIWKGALEWQEMPTKNNPNNLPQIINRSMACQMSIQPGETLQADMWPSKMIMQPIPQQLLVPLVPLFRNSRTVGFHFSNNDQDALRALYRVVEGGFAGCVHFPHVPQCNIRMLMLVYSAKKRAFMVLIPQDQASLVNGIRTIIINHKKKQQQKALQRQQQLQVVQQPNTAPMQQFPQQQQQAPSSAQQQFGNHGNLGGGRNMMSSGQSAVCTSSGNMNQALQRNMQQNQQQHLNRQQQLMEQQRRQQFQPRLQQQQTNQQVLNQRFNHQQQQQMHNPNQWTGQQQLRPPGPMMQQLPLHPPQPQQPMGSLQPNLLEDPYLHDFLN